MSQQKLFVPRSPGRSKDESRYEVLFDPPVGMDKFETEKFSLDLRKAEEAVVTIVEAYLKRRGLYQVHNADTAPQNISLPTREKSVVSQFQLYPEDAGSLTLSAPASVTQLQLFRGGLNQVASRLVSKSVVALHQPFQKDVRLVLPASLKAGSVDQANWFYYSAGSDKRQESDHVYRCHSKFYGDHPQYYYGAAAYVEEMEFRKLLSKYKFGLPQTTPRCWINQAYSLNKCFQGKVLDLVDAVKSVDGWLKLKAELDRDTKGKQKHFLGYGSKIMSLFFTFLDGAGIRKMPDDAFPVDVHGQRFLFQTGALKLKQTAWNSDLEPILRRFYCGVSHKHGFKKGDVAHAIWHNGSKLCDSCTKMQDVSHVCAVYELCKGPVETRQYFKTREWIYPLIFREKGSERTLQVPPNSPLLNPA